MLIYERLMISSDPFEVQVCHIYASCTHPHFSFPIFSFATHRRWTKYISTLLQVILVDFSIFLCQFQVLHIVLEA